MKKIMLMLTIGLLLTTVRVHADMLPQPEEGDLYQVFNTLFLEGENTDRMGSDIELLNSDYFMADGSDLVFGNPGDTLRIELTFRESGFGGDLGIWNGNNDTDVNNYQTVIRGDEITKGRISRHDTTFTIPEGFTFSDTRMKNGEPQQRWSADRQLNPLGRKDHFLAFAIDDSAMVDSFNRQFGTRYSAGMDDLWMIAFEELNLGDADYNDLVAVVSRPALQHAPIPGAVVLMFSGLATFVGLRRRSAG